MEYSERFVLDALWSLFYIKNGSVETYPTNLDNPEEPDTHFFADEASYSNWLVVRLHIKFLSQKCLVIRPLF